MERRNAAMAVPATDRAKRPRRRNAGGVKGFLQNVRDRRYRVRQFMNGCFFVFILIVARPVPWMLAAGACLAVAGSAVRLWASGHIRKNDELATDGPYAFVRHPLYVGNLLLGTGFALASGKLWVLAVWAVLFLVFHPAAIRREDLKLSKRFPEVWREWAARTPALLPSGLLKMKARPSLGHWSLRQSLRNGEPLYAIVLLGGLVWLYFRLP
jgi:hypothetical protein